MRTFKRQGYFKGCYHVYLLDGKRHIEEYCAELFEIEFPSAQTEYMGPSMMDDLSDCGFTDDLLNIKEIEDNKTEDFFFEILGILNLDFITAENSYYGGEETDYEVYFNEYKVIVISETTAEYIYSIYNPASEFIND